MRHLSWGIDLTASCTVSEVFPGISNPPRNPLSRSDSRVATSASDPVSRIATTSDQQISRSGKSSLLDARSIADRGRLSLPCSNTTCRPVDFHCNSATIDVSNRLFAKNRLRLTIADPNAVGSSFERHDRHRVKCVERLIRHRGPEARHRPSKDLPTSPHGIAEGCSFGRAPLELGQNLIMTAAFVPYSAFLPHRKPVGDVTFVRAKAEGTLPVIANPG